MNRKRRARPAHVRGSARGFTLIEVLVALGVVALALGAAGISMGQMIDTANAMRERSYASWIAQNQIAELRLSGTIPEVGTSNGEVDFANNTWGWRTIVSETGVENLLRVDVEITRIGTEDVIRTVTGFVGEPYAPGLANAAWSRRQDNRGDER